MAYLQAITDADFRNDALASVIENIDGDKLFNIIFDYMNDAEFDKFSSHFITDYADCFVPDV